MKQRAAITSLAVVLLATAVIGGMTLAAGNTPLLGLDLQGGVSVVLQPVGEVPEGGLDQARDIINNRVDALGVAEPEITVQGDTILVQIPGIEDRDRALELVGQTAELRFRPVLRQEVAPGALEDFEVPTTLAPDATGLPGDTTTSAPEATSTTAPGSDTTLESTATTAPATTTAPTTAGADEAGLGLAPGEQAAGMQSPPAGEDETGQPATTAPATTAPATTAPPTTAPPTTDPATDDTLAPPTGGPTTVPAAPETPTGSLAEAELTSREDDDADAVVVLAQYDDDGNEVLRYELGPAALTGEALEGAQAVFQGQWTVTPRFKSGSPGIDDLNAIASECFSRTAQCPTGQLAIVLDQEVISAPGIEQPSYERDSIQISGSFNEREAKELALVLRYGALPVELEPQAAQVVSATVGEDALAAGVTAGLIGLGLAAIYMLVLYRFLGLVALISLSLSAAWLWALVTYLSESRGLALTLAGVTGLIVSIGTTLDSNIVYFEHLKEDTRNGRSLRSATERSFESSFRTIVAANMVSLIGAAILYWMTVGGVRGFALFLGLSTVFDLVATWFFLRPSVMLIGRSRWFREHPRVLALTPPDDESATAAGPVAPAGAS